jgi:hypothetical protein
MSDTLDNTNAGSAKRPSFLTVLCILTFIGSGLGVLGGILGLIGSSALGMFSPQGTMVVQLLGLAAAGLCLFGAIQMWGLKKQGFMLYLAGAVLGIVGPIISALTIASYMQDAMGEANAALGELGGDAGSTLFADTMVAAAQTAAWTGVAMAVVINLAFILMYNANKKHLVN